MTLRRLTKLTLLALVLVACQATGDRLQTTPIGYRLDDVSVAPSPYARTKWKAFLLAGDHSIPAFDNAVTDLAALLEVRGVEVVQRFTAAPNSVPGKVMLSTEANLRRAASTFKVTPGEGCLFYATSHGDVPGLYLSRDTETKRTLSPASLKSVLTMACGDAPTIVVMSGCHTGTFLRAEALGPNMIMLTAAEANRASFGCRAGRKYTYYDECFLREFPAATTWQDLYRRVTGCVEVQEKSLRQFASNPQAFFGRQMKDLPLPSR